MGPQPQQPAWRELSDYWLDMRPPANQAGMSFEYGLICKRTVRSKVAFTDDFNSINFGRWYCPTRHAERHVSSEVPSRMIWEKSILLPIRMPWRTSIQKLENRNFYEAVKQAKQAVLDD
jgi:hypothetical protein